MQHDHELWVLCDCVDDAGEIDVTFASTERALVLPNRRAGYRFDDPRARFIRADLFHDDDTIINRDEYLIISGHDDKRSDQLRCYRLSDLLDAVKSSPLPPKPTETKHQFSMTKLPPPGGPAHVVHVPIWQRVYRQTPECLGQHDLLLETRLDEMKIYSLTTGNHSSYHSVITHLFALLT
jgi:hypothetical protein